MEFTFTRVEPVIDKVSNEVLSFIVGATAVDPVTGKSAYIDTKAATPEPTKTLENWSTDDIRELCLQVAVDNNWYAVLGAQVDNANSEPTIGANITI